jgi:two-component system response regulator NreC
LGRHLHCTDEPRKTFEKELTLNLLLVDGSTVFRMGFRAMCGATEDLSVAGECGDGAQACLLAASLAPDVVVTDLHLPDRNGVALARELARTMPSVRILLLSSHAPEAIVHQALAAGATGYVTKGQTPQEIAAAVRAVGQGETVLPPGVTPPPPRPAGREHNRSVSHAIERLSQRERQIFDLVVWGSSNKQIAGRLGISIKTVETHRGHINGKLRVHTSADIVRLASLWGMLSAPPANGVSGVNGANSVHELPQ